MPPQHFPKPHLVDGEDVGQILLKNGSSADVYRRDDEAGIFLIAHQGPTVVGFLGLLHIPTRPNLVMAKNTQSYLQGQHIFLNLLQFARHKLGYRIISDYEMTTDGEGALLSLVNKTNLGWQIYDFDSDQTYSLNDTRAVKPETDQNPGPDQMRWFYLLEASQRFPIHKSTLLSQYYYEPID